MLLCKVAWVIGSGVLTAHWHQLMYVPACIRWCGCTTNCFLCLQLVLAQLTCMTQRAVELCRREQYD